VQNVITYDAVIGVSNPDLKLFPGMTANVKILVNQRTNVLTVPNAALRYHPQDETAVAARSGRKGAAPAKAVWVLGENNKPRRVVVMTGESDGTYTEVTQGGLKDGDRLIVAALPKSASAPGGGPGASAGGRGGRGPGF
jgi:HlyD family secretion protein